MADTAKAIELASAYISLNVRTDEIPKQIKKSLAGTDRIGADAGRDMGRRLAAELGSSGGQAGQRFIREFEGQTRQTKVKVDADKAGAKAGSSAGGEFVSGFASSVSSIGSKAGPIGAALTAVVGLGAAAGTALAKNIAAGMETERAADFVQARAGLSPKQMVDVGHAAGKAYMNGFGKSVADNMDTLVSARQSGLLDMGPKSATMSGAEQTIQRLQTVSDLLGEDIPAVSRAAAQAVRTGLAGSATDALNLLTRATQKGLNTSGDLLDTVTEYGTQFRKVGLSGADAMGLISQAVQGGARDTDIAADAIKEFSIRAVDGSETTTDAYQDLGLNADVMAQRFAAGGETSRKAFGQILDAVRAITDPVTQARIQVSLFGTQSEDLGDALNRMNLDTAAHEFGNLAGATDDAANTISGNAASAVESAKRSIEVSVSGVQTALAQGFSPAITGAADVVKTHGGDITDFFTEIGKAAIAGTQSAMQAVAELTGAFGGLQDFVGNIFGGVTKFEAWQADFRGDHDVAAELRKQAEDQFAWGDTAKKAEQSIRGAIKRLDPLYDKLDNYGDNAKKAQALTNALGDSFDRIDGTKIVIGDNTPDVTKKLTDLGIAVQELPDGAVTLVPNTPKAQEQIDAFIAQNNPTAPVTAPVSVDTKPAASQLNSFISQWSDYLTTAVGGTPVGANPLLAPYLGANPGMPGGGGKAIPGGAAASAYIDSVTGAKDGLKPGISRVKADIGRWFPGLSIGGYSPNVDQPWDEHQTGEAIDVMIPKELVGTAMGKSLGDQIVQRALAGGSSYALWQQTQWNPDGSFSGMTDRGSVTENHGDHVHIRLKEKYAAGGRIRGAGGPKSDLVPMWGSNGEHVFTAADVKAMGGQGNVYAFRNALHRKDGGAIYDPTKVREAQDGITDLQGDLAVSQARLEEVRAGKDVKPSQVLRAQQDVAELQRKLDQSSANYSLIARGGEPTNYASTNRIFSADDSVSMAEAVLAELRGDPDTRQSALLEAQNSLDISYREAAQARADQATEQREQAVKTAPKSFSDIIRTEGFVPTNAGNTGVAGTSSLAGILNLGNEAIGGLIDTGASLASTAVSGAIAAGSFGAGAAAGPAASYGIQLGATELKRGVSYGFQMASIVADAGIEQLFPFGAPRWLGYDYTQFAPKLGIQQAMTTSLEQAGNKAINDYFAPKSPADPGTTVHGQGNGAAPGAMAAGLGQPAPPTDPFGTNSQNPGAPKVAPPPTQVPGQEGQDWLKKLGVYDTGGWLKPGELAYNAGRDPEPILTGKQWSNMARAAENPATSDGRLAEHLTIQALDMDDAMRKLTKRQRLNALQFTGRP